MAIPASGPISFSQINIEKRSASNQQINLGRESVRLLAGTQTDVPRTGSVSVSNLRDKAWGIEFNESQASQAFNPTGSFDRVISFANGDNAERSLPLLRKGVRSINNRVAYSVYGAGGGGGYGGSPTDSGISGGGGAGAKIPLNASWNQAGSQFNYTTISDDWRLHIKVGSGGAAGILDNGQKLRGGDGQNSYIIFRSIFTGVNQQTINAPGGGGGGPNDLGGRADGNWDAILANGTRGSGGGGGAASRLNTGAGGFGGLNANGDYRGGNAWNDGSIVYGGAGGGAGGSANLHTPGAGIADSITGTTITYGQGGPGRGPSGSGWPDNWSNQPGSGGRGAHFTTGVSVNAMSGRPGVVIFRALITSADALYVGG